MADIYIDAIDKFLYSFTKIALFDAAESGLDVKKFDVCDNFKSSPQVSDMKGADNKIVSILDDHIFKKDYDVIYLNDFLHRTTNIADVLINAFQRSEYVVVKVRNSAYIMNRIRFLFLGKTYQGYAQWFDSAIIKNFSINEFLLLCNDLDIFIDSGFSIDNGNRHELSHIRYMMNFFSKDVCLVLKKKP
jgi:hypothetical protein